MSGSPKRRPKSAIADTGPDWDLREGECISGLAHLDDASIDVVITDPPYEAEAHTSRRLVARTGGTLEVEPLTFPPITEEQRAESARHMARLARRWILVFCQVEGAMKWRAALEAAGAVYKRTCLWVKPDGKPQYCGDRPGIGYESIVACHAPGRAESAWTGTAPGPSSSSDSRTLPSGSSALPPARTRNMTFRVPSPPRPSPAKVARRVADDRSANGPRRRHSSRRKRAAQPRCGV